MFIPTRHIDYVEDHLLHHEENFGDPKFAVTHRLTTQFPSGGRPFYPCGAASVFFCIDMACKIRRSHELYALFTSLINMLQRVEMITVLLKGFGKKSVPIV